MKRGAILSYTDSKINLKNNHFSIFNSYAPNVREHGHKFLEFAYVRSGVMEHFINGSLQILRPGDYYIIDRGFKHYYNQVGDDRLIVCNILFYPSFLDHNLVGLDHFDDIMNSYLLRFCYRNLKDSPAGVVFHDHDGKILKLLDSLYEEYKLQKEGYLEYVRCLFVEILIHTMRKIGSKHTPEQKSEAISAITDYVSVHYKENIQLQDLSRKVGYSMSYISKKFRAEIGMSFMEYLQKIRIEQSCRLLETTDMKVSDIATAVGYENVKFFNQVFRRRLNISPREFRAYYK